jgi:amidohydrolase
MLAQAVALSGQLVAWRRDFHMHPELSFQEFRTAQVVAKALAEMGIEVRTEVGRTGVVGVLGSGSPVVAIRADMDALPIQEANPVDYASQNPGVMHACGHDAHTAILLGTAKLLASLPSRPPGQIRFLFQPSEESSDEENKSGAVRMIEDGALQGVDAVIALHLFSDLPARKVFLAPGYFTASEDNFYITLKGDGGHGAYPHQGIDPIFILAQVLNAINGIRARRISPTRRAVISVGSVHGGTAPNVIPNEIELTGTMRSFDDETRDRLKVELARALGVARALGGDYELELERGYPSTFNDPLVTETIEGAARALFGPDVLPVVEPGMAAEDFSYMSREAPGAIFFLGAEIGDIPRAHHTPLFDLDEGVMPMGVALLAESACRLLVERAALPGTQAGIER